MVAARRPERAYLTSPIYNRQGLLQRPRVVVDLVEALLFNGARNGLVEEVLWDGVGHAEGHAVLVLVGVDA